MPITAPPSNYSATPPQIDRSTIPANEQTGLSHVVDLLASLGRYERRFSLAVTLFDLCHDENSNMARQVETGSLSFTMLDSKTNTLSGWMTMAAREGAMSIYHFGQAATAIVNMKECPALRAKVDHESIRLARKLFDATFPDNIDMRNAIAHVAEASGTTKERLINSIKGPVKYVFGRATVELTDSGGFYRFEDNLYDRTYCVTYDGRMLRYEVSAANAAKLSKIRQQIYSAFSGAI
jgi:hypothetical protein